jgi:hypothetical protein
VQVTIHYDPIVTQDPRVAALRGLLAQRVAAIDPALSIHDLRIVPGTTHTNVVFDLVLPAGYAGDRAALVAQLREAVRGQDATYIAVINVEQGYASARRPEE